ncbi:MAG: laccase domain-containing protein, partial [Firmicutes bacterium]|nr:laccase domain-containing protein [Bacillota bacterium]
PGIGACCFEVGPDVAEQFTDAFWWAEDYVYCHPGGRPRLDLKGINAELLMLEGVTKIEISPHCTCCEPEMFWSYRRCKDSTRMLAFIEKRME